MLGDIHVGARSSVKGHLVKSLGLQPGACLVHMGWLSCGWLPSSPSVEEWRRARDQCLGRLVSGRYPEVDGMSWGSEIEFLTRIDLLQSAESITLWLGPTRESQLLLSWTVQYYRAIDVPLSRLRVVQCRHKVRKKTEMREAFFLDPEEIRAQRSGSMLTQEEIAELDAAWEAITASDPTALVAFLSGANACLPLLSTSLKSMILRYPDVKTGLSRIEELLLMNVRDEGPSVGRAIGYTMGHDIDDPDQVSDAYLCDRLVKLSNASLSHPFLSLAGSTPDLPMGRKAKVKLTEAGKLALAGEANFVELNGIDEWIGGVHLDSRAGEVWYRDGDVLLPIQH